MEIQSLAVGFILDVYNRKMSNRKNVKLYNSNRRAKELLWEQKNVSTTWSRV